MWLIKMYKKGKDPRWLAIEPKKPKKYRACVCSSLPPSSSDVPRATPLADTSCDVPLPVGATPSRTASEFPVLASRWTSRTPAGRMACLASPSGASSASERAERAAVEVGRTPVAGSQCPTRHE